MKHTPSQHPVWYPYTQHHAMTPPLQIVGASGFGLQLDNRNWLIDGLSSWWSAIHGYNHPELNHAIHNQLSNFAHVMMGGLTHTPAQTLAKTLIEITPHGLNHVFFSDSGSVGCEVAMKMAIQYYKNRQCNSKTKFIALRRGYHGDTLGVMSVGTDDIAMHDQFKDIVFPQFFVSAGDIDELKHRLERDHHQIAGMIIEPIMQGAGGCQVYEANYIDKAKALCDEYDVLLIADEVATGFGRTGTVFAMNQTQVVPDIMILGKALTAGYMGHAATLATSRVFDSFLSDANPRSALMHGPTFMGNPLACSVALASIHLFFRSDYLLKIKSIEQTLKKWLMPCQNYAAVHDVRVKGAMGVIEFKSPDALIGCAQYCQKNGVWLRPFDRYLYTMPPYIISQLGLEKIAHSMVSWAKQCH